MKCNKPSNLYQSQGFLSLLHGVIVTLLISCGSSPVAKPQENPAPTQEEIAADKAYTDCRAELMRVPWVKDVYLSPGHLNIGVLRYEKQWGSPMICRFVNAILKKHGVIVQWIRFVDIQQVVNERKSIRDAEITKYEFNSEQSK